MSTIRINKRISGYSLIDNRAISDSALSFGARGLLVWLLSKPDGWELRVKALIAASPQGREAVQSLLRELERNHYLVRIRTWGPGGLIEWRSDVYECQEDCLEALSAMNGKPGHGAVTMNGFTVHGSTGNGSTGNGSTGNGEAVHIVITDQVITDQVITDQVITDKERAIVENAQHFDSTPKGGNAQHPPTVGKSAKPDPLEVEIDREGKCSASAAKNALGDAKLGLGSYASIDPDYKRFKGIYEAMTRVVNAHYGIKARAEDAWADCEATGLITSVFWEGLEVSIAAIKDEFKRTGRAIGVKSAANYLIDRDWEEALIRRDIQLQAKNAGVDLTSPQSVKAAGKQSERDKVSEEAREILRRRAGNA